jgi:hypothetical protein
LDASRLHSLNSPGGGNERSARAESARGLSNRTDRVSVAQAVAKYAKLEPFKANLVSLLRALFHFVLPQQPDYCQPVSSSYRRRRHFGPIGLAARTGGGVLGGSCDEVCHRYFQEHLLGAKLPLVYTDSGSGDKTFDCVLSFCILLLAAAATVVWSFLDRKRENYVTVYKWFRVFMRFALACQMFVYGFAKAAPLQMPFPQQLD